AASFRDAPAPADVAGVPPLPEAIPLPARRAGRSRRDLGAIPGGRSRVGGGRAGREGDPCDQRGVVPPVAMVGSSRRPDRRLLDSPSVETRAELPAPRIVVALLLGSPAHGGWD